MQSKDDIKALLILNPVAKVKKEKKKKKKRKGKNPFSCPTPT